MRLVRDMVHTNYWYYLFRILSQKNWRWRLHCSITIHHYIRPPGRRGAPPRGSDFSCQHCSTGTCTYTSSTWREMVHEVEPRRASPPSFLAIPTGDLQRKRYSPQLLPPIATCKCWVWVSTELSAAFEMLDKQGTPSPQSTEASILYPGLEGSISRLQSLRSPGTFVQMDGTPTMRTPTGMNLTHPKDTVDSTSQWCPASEP